MSVGVWRVSVGVCRVSGGVIGGYKTHMNSQNPRYNQYNHTSGFLPVPPNHSNYLKWSKFSDPMYGGSNELFDKNQNFPLFLNIKLHLKMPVNFNFLNILSFLGKSVPPLLLWKEIPKEKAASETRELQAQRRAGQKSCRGEAGSA